MPFNIHPVREFVVRPALPKQLSRMPELAYNILWAWEPSIRTLFRRLDPALWKESGYNPVVMLGRVAQTTLERAATDPRYVAQYQLACQRFDANMLKAADVSEHKLIAYFSAEYGLTECMPVYSGGLGVLAGDHLKSASDLGILGKMNPTNFGNVQPRVGIAYAVRKGKGVVRSSFGIYNGSLEYSSLVNGWHGAAPFTTMNQPLIPEFADPANDLAQFSTTVPVSVSDSVQVIDNYLTSEKVNDCGLNNPTWANASPSLIWTATGTSCPGVSTTGLQVTINRGCVSLQPMTIGQNSANVYLVGTCVKIVYPYVWQFTSVAGLFSSFTGPSNITTSAAAFNEN